MLNWRCNCALHASAPPTPRLHHWSENAGQQRYAGRSATVGALAEEEGHHPDIYLAWGKVRITIWTHKIDGLSRSDFVLAAKIDQR